MAPNWRPRIIHSVAVAGVGLTVAGPLPVFLWLVAIFSNLAYGQHLLKSKARANERRSLIIANGLALPALQVVMLLAIWRAEGDLARAFALTACLFGGVFVLLQYYADRRLLTAMLTPYALLLGLMAWSAAAQRGLGAGTLLVLACCVLMVGNFVLIAQRTLSSGKAVGEVPGARPFLRVLVAEDNAVNQMVLRAILGEFNFEVHVVEDGAAAVSAWEADNWDLVLMDIQMPVMDGVSAATAIRARESQTGRARTPIIAVTADVMRDQLTRYQAAGMDGTVAKPIVPELLLEAIERASDPGPVTNSDAPVAPDFGAAAS
jgi:CheY-like chemotaxis protein